MSEMRHFTGKLVRISHGEHIEKEAKRILGDVDISPFSTYTDKLLDEGDYEEYFVINDVLYKAKDLVEHDYEEDSYTARKINGNDIEFDVRYYDGGGDLTEAIETATKGLRIK